MVNDTGGPCGCGACEMCLRRAALDLDDLRETAARLASHAGLVDLAGRALTADAALCAKIVATSAGFLSVMLVGLEEAAAGATLRAHELTMKAGTGADGRIRARVRQLLRGAERVPAFAKKPGAS